MFAFIGYHLVQNRSAINHDCLPSTEPFLHQKQIGLCNVMSFADPPHRQTLNGGLLKNAIRFRYVKER